jgi:hypothetical protein
MLGQAGFFIDLILAPVLEPDQNHEDDQGPLNREVVPEREAQERILIQRLGVPRQNESKNEPDDENEVRQVARPRPVTLSCTFGSISHREMSPPFFPIYTKKKRALAYRFEVNV